MGRSKVGERIDRNAYLQYERASVQVRDGRVAPPDKDIGEGAALSANYVWTGSAGTIHSAAAKAGVMSMTQTLAAEWAKHQIRVNAVAPGPIESPGAAKQLWNSPEAVQRITEMVPLKRWGTPREVADAVAFLVAPGSGFITGEILTIDGGSWLGRGTFGFV